MPQVSDKSPNIFQAYGIFLLGNKHPTIKKLESTYSPSVHGHKAWSSSFLLMDYLLHQHSLKPKLKVMELGCGWGPASVFCAENADCHVTGVDLDPAVFPFLEAQAEINGVTIQTKRSSFEKLSQKTLQSFELVLGADICFWSDFTKIHFNLIKRALKAGVKDIIFADPGREPFYQLAELCQQYFGAEYLEWYCLEPSKFEGYVLHIKNPKN